MLAARIPCWFPKRGHQRSPAMRMHPWMKETPGRRRLLRYLFQPRSSTTLARARFPILGVAKVMQRMGGSASSGSWLSRFMVHSIATAPPSECPEAEAQSAQQGASAQKSDAVPAATRGTRLARKGFTQAVPKCRIRALVQASKVVPAACSCPGGSITDSPAHMTTCRWMDG
jgi:hypothetical protein